MEKVSVIIPVKPGGAVKALEGLKALTYPIEAVEVLIAEGRCPSRQRNRAAAEAAGDILYFLDDDSLVSPEFLRRAVSHYRDDSVAAAGGPSLTPDTDTPLQQAFGLAFASLFGGGGVRNRYRRTGEARATSDRELILCNLSFRREMFLAAGGFDERLYPNEENELMERLRRSGRRLVHDPELAVWRSQRRTFGAFVRQLFGYGRGRGEQSVLSGVVRPVTFLPSLFLLYLCLLPFAAGAVYYLPLLCYFALNILFSAGEALRAGKGRLAPLLLVIFPAFHLCYGAGMIPGLLSPRFRKGRPDEGPVSIRKVKGFGESSKLEAESSKLKAES